MNALKYARVGTRLTASFGVVLALLLGVAVMGIWNLAQIDDYLRDITEDNNAKIEHATVMRIAVNRVSAEVRDLVMVTDEAEHQRLEAGMKQARTDYDGAEERLAALLANGGHATDQERQLLERIKAHKAAVRPITNKVIALGMANKNQEAVQVIGAEFKPALSGWTKLLGELTDLEARLNHEVAQEATSAYETSRKLMLAMAAAALVLGIGAAWWVTRSITRQLGGEPDYAAGVVSAIAAGDLAVDVQVRSGDSTSLLAAMKGMRDSLARIVGQVRQASDSIATGSTQIATGNADLSQRTEQQASNLQETAASMEQMSATVRQNADIARTATQLAASASAAATRGGEVVGQVVATMDDITSSSKRIADIIGVIDGIAFQTNILALNAAVEAARAGEQGRGFAVVASEVRSLAQRSADAAKEIKTLISQSVEKVEAGSRLVGEAGASMDGIVGEVKRVADLIGEISQATQEQTQGIGQVSDAVSQLDQVTQQNAALVEESAAAAESLKQQAGNLTDIVGVFKLEAGAGR